MCPRAAVGAQAGRTARHDAVADRNLSSSHLAALGEALLDFTMMADLEVWLADNIPKID
jgi:uncharacterized protein DUF4351